MVDGDCGEEWELTGGVRRTERATDDRWPDTRIYEKQRGVNTQKNNDDEAQDDRGAEQTMAEGRRSDQSRHRGWTWSLSCFGSGSGS